MTPDEIAAVKAALVKAWTRLCGWDEDITLRQILALVWHVGMVICVIGTVACLTFPSDAKFLHGWLTFLCVDVISFPALVLAAWVLVGANEGVIRLRGKKRVAYLQRTRLERERLEAAVFGNEEEGDAQRALNPYKVGE